MPNVKAQSPKEIQSSNDKVYFPLTFILSPACGGEDKGEGGI